MKVMITRLSVLAVSPVIRQETCLRFRDSSSRARTAETPRDLQVSAAPQWTRGGRSYKLITFIQQCFYTFNYSSTVTKVTFLHLFKCDFTVSTSKSY